MTTDQAVQQLQDKLTQLTLELIRAAEQPTDREGAAGRTWPAASLAEEGQT